MAAKQKPTEKLTEPKSWTIGITNKIWGGKIQSWLIQPGITRGEDWIWRTVVSDVKDRKDAFKIAQDRYRNGAPSEVFKETSERAA